MAHAIGGVPVQGIIAQQMQSVRETAEKAVEANIKEVMQDPAKSVRELQQPSPFSQFLDIKI